VKRKFTAEKITIGKRYQTQAQLMRGFFVYIAEDKNEVKANYRKHAKIQWRDIQCPFLLIWKHCYKTCRSPPTKNIAAWQKIIVAQQK